MNGIELSRAYYERFGEPMLKERFPALWGLIAVGICGSGSECFGYDDEISRDHDFEPGFMIFLPGEDKVDRRTAFLLERAYSALPKEFGGARRQMVNPVGGARRGVFRTADFFTAKTGSPDGTFTLAEWLTLPEYARAEATNGGIFHDGPGEVSEIRRRILDMPEDARRKRLAGNIITMAQSGQYNYPRCLAHSERGAAQLAATEFVQSAMRCAFLLARRPMPYYKWSFRALRALTPLGGCADAIEYLISSDNSPENAAKKERLIAEVCRAVADEVASQDIAAADSELERLAYAINDTVADSTVRNLSIFHAL